MGLCIPQGGTGKTWAVLRQRIPLRQSAKVYIIFSYFFFFLTLLLNTSPWVWLSHEYTDHVDCITHFYSFVEVRCLSRANESICGKFGGVK